MDSGPIYSTQSLGPKTRIPITVKWPRDQNHESVSISPYISNLLIPGLLYMHVSSATPNLRDGADSDRPYPVQRTLSRLRGKTSQADCIQLRHGSIRYDSRASENYWSSNSKADETTPPTLEMDFFFELRVSRVIGRIFPLDDADPSALTVRGSMTPRKQEQPTSPQGSDGTYSAGNKRQGGAWYRALTLRRSPRRPSPRSSVGRSRRAGTSSRR